MRESTDGATSDPGAILRGVGDSERTNGVGHWTFFTNHAHVLFVLAREPDLRLRDVAERVQITERAAQRIVRELEEGGYLSVEKTGRRNHYVIQPRLSLRHPVEAHCSIADLLRVIGGRQSSARNPRPRR